MPVIIYPYDWPRWLGRWKPILRSNGAELGAENSRIACRIRRRTCVHFFIAPFQFHHRSLWQSRRTQAGDGILQRPLRPVPIVGPRAILSYRQTGPQPLQFSDGPNRIVPSTEAP